MKTTGYDSITVAKRLKVPHSTLLRWVHHGLLSPKRVAGRGNPFRWTLKNIREAAVLVQLRRYGMSAQQLNEATDFLIKRGDNPMSSGQFLVMSSRRGKQLVKVCDGQREAVQLLGAGKGQFILFVPPVDMAAPVKKREGRRP